jgi:mono/diheme cytochrome c family protein
MWSTDTAQAQAPAGGTGPIWAGVYTAAQAENGETTFMGRCAGCHRPDLRGGPNGPNYAPPLGGDEFMLRWDSNTVNRLFRIIRDTMPRGTPGILGEQTTLDVVSFILKFNGYPAGMSALTADATALEKITFVPKAGEAVKREIANFAPVEAVGCLTRGPKTWMLTRASDVLITDCTYLDEEYPRKIRWGHSSVSQVASLAGRAEITAISAPAKNPLSRISTAISPSSRRKPSPLTSLPARLGLRSAGPLLRISCASRRLPAWCGLSRMHSCRCSLPSPT